MRSLRVLLLAAAAAGLATAARADVKPHPLFTDNMVLRRGIECPVWGKADPGEEVTATIRTEAASVTTLAVTADKAFHPAKAKVEGNTVVVTCETVGKPVAVRYGWKNYPVVNLYNTTTGEKKQLGLPASPFRTDDFPLTTAAQKK